MLDPIDEIELIHQLNLRNFKNHSKGFNFSCPLCNEGSSPWKRRAFILVDDGKRGHNTFYCHNCLGEGMGVKNFIQLIDHEVYRKYLEKEKSLRIDKLYKGDIGLRKKRIYQHRKENEKKGLKYLFRLSPKTFVPAREHQPAVDYARSRKIPEFVIDGLYYSKPLDNFTYGDMLIFPLTYEDDIVFGFHGRSLKGKKFRTFSKNDSFKIYNLFEVDRDSRVYIFESIIDSYAMFNSVAMLGTSLSAQVKKMLPKRVFVFDNDRTGVEKTIQYLKNGETCFIWPDAVRSKDTNDLIRKGISPIKIRKMIEKNIYKGPMGVSVATLRLNKFKSVRRK